MKNAMLKKLIVLSLGTVLCLAVICMGVFSIQNFKLEATGIIDFIAYEKLVYIEKVELKNFVTTDDNGETYVTQNKELSAYAGKYISNSENVTPIDISNVQVMNGEELTIEITMKSLSEDEIVVSGTNNTTSGITITYSNTTLPANSGGTISSATSEVFTITISNANTGTVDLNDVKISVSYAPVAKNVLTFKFNSSRPPESYGTYFSTFLIRADNGAWSPLSEFSTNDTLTFERSISIKSTYAQDSDEHIVNDVASATSFGRYVHNRCVIFGINNVSFGINHFESKYVTDDYKNFATFILNESITLSNIYMEIEGSGGSND